MKKLIHEIHKGKNLTKNLRVYKDMAVPVYTEYASLELTFSAYTMVQELEEEKPELAAREKDVVDAILGALREMSEEKTDYEKLLLLMQKLRQDITEKMDMFTAYTDRLMVYEYVINRMELSFETEKELNRQLASVDEEQLLQRITAWIFAEEDRSLIRERLCQVIGQIPVHMTKTKFFEGISETITLYKDGDKSSLDDFIYMIRTSAMLYEPSAHVGEYTELEEALAELENTDFSSITKERYKQLTTVLGKGIHYVYELTDFYYSLQETVNDIYALCLSMPYAQDTSKLVNACKSVWKCLANKEYMDEMLVPLEGRIEPYVEKTSYFESVLYEVKSVYKEEMKEAGVTSFFEDFSLVANLLSDSLFIDLDKVQKNEKADASYVKECTARLLDEMSDRMSRVSRPVKRAIMGLVLEKLPMMFQNSEQVLEYIRVNLFGCQDKAEKLTVISILTDLIREEM